MYHSTISTFISYFIIQLFKKNEILNKLICCTNIIKDNYYQMDNSELITIKEDMQELVNTMKKLQKTIELQNEKIVSLEEIVKQQAEQITRIEKLVESLQEDNDELMYSNHGPKCGCFECERGRAFCKS